MIDHRRALMLAAASIDFALDAADRDALGAHLRVCADCRLDHAGFRRDAALLATLPPIAPPSWVVGTIRRPRRPNPFVLLAAAALLVTATGVAVAVGGRLLHDRTALALPTSEPTRTAPTASAPVRPTAAVATAVPASVVPATTPSGYLLVRRTDPAETEPLPVTFGLVHVTSGTYLSLGVAVDAALSMDGRSVHLVREDATCTPTLVTVDLKGVELERIAGTFLPGDGPFAWSPDGDRVAFGRYVNGEPSGMCGSQGGVYGPAELLSATFVIDRATQWAVGPPLVAESAPATYAWSPDGTSMLLADGSPRLWILDAASGTRTDLGAALKTIGAADLWDARWAPDGSSIAFVYSSPVGDMLGLADVAGRTASTVGQYGNVTNAPAWAPDGRSIAVVRGIKGGYLVLFDVGGAQPEALLEQAEFDELAPFGWSPDGSWLADTAQDGELVLISANGLELKTVFAPPTGSSVDFVGWAPA